MWFILFFAVVWSLVLLTRLFSLQIANFETWQDWAIKQHFTEIRLASERGPIYDRQGRLMAVSVPAGSVYVRPRQVKDRELTAKKIAELLKVKHERVRSALESSQPFVWVDRQVPRAVAEKVSDLKMPGVGHVLESRRFYPYNSAASTLIGKVGVDGVGLSGIEAVFEEYLHGKNIKTRMVRDAFGNMIQVETDESEEFAPPKGSPLNLTLDADIQIIVDEEIEAGRLAAKAKNAMAVMIDAQSGEVLALSQAPAVNFNKGKIDPAKDLKNLLLETVFEPGSIFKPIVAAAAIETKMASPREIIDCEGGRFPVGRHTIKDVHPNERISFRDVVVRSSNIGMTKIGMRMGEQKLYEFLRLFGFGQEALNLLPGETSGILRPVESWAKVDVATHSFGQGIAVTPLQVVRATAVIANGGRLPTLQVVQDGSRLAQKRIISERTAEAVREMMYGVVEDEHGTGKNAAIAGIRVGGKTGTAQKPNLNGRGYLPGAYMASFVGFTDGAALGVPRTFVLLVIIDEPNAGSIYGGTLAAPVFKRIMQRTLHLLTTKSGLGSGLQRIPIRPFAGDDSEGLLPAAFRSS
ncbi:MAG: penicillin-binding protein 2 [Deltaproteobacteria bacterium]|nr:penicillin-binding protein 2 [Deltaproteobacteria bacterium]